MGDNERRKGNAKDHGEELALITNQHFKRYEVHAGSVLAIQGEGNPMLAKQGLWEGFPHSSSGYTALLRTNHAVRKKILDIDEAHRDILTVYDHELVDLSLLDNASSFLG